MWVNSHARFSSLYTHVWTCASVNWASSKWLACWRRSPWGAECGRAVWREKVGTGVGGDVCKRGCVRWGPATFLSISSLLALALLLAWNCLTLFSACLPAHCPCIADLSPPPGVRQAEFWVWNLTCSSPCSWASYSASLILSFFICRMKSENSSGGLDIMHIKLLGCIIVAICLSASPLRL